MNTLPVETRALLALGLCLAVRQDLEERRIANGLNLVLAAGGLIAWSLGARGLDGVVSESAPGLVLAFCVGFAVFALGWFGGGDAKLLAASGAWVGRSAIPSLLLFTALSGGVVSVATWWFERRGARRGVPYGAAIAAGTILTLIFKMMEKR